MFVVPPRLSSILMILLEENKPVSVDSLSKKLGTSRRTIFRELENIDVFLQKAGLALDTKIGEGLLLRGDEKKKTALNHMLNSSRSIPQNKQDRQILLALLLMEASETQKLYYYAKALEVSEATISLDMDAMESRFRLFHLQLQRRQGVRIVGAEEDIRHMMVDIIMKLDNLKAFNRQYGHFPESAVTGIQTLIQETWVAKLDWMTEESVDMLKLQLLVMIVRVQRHHTLTDEQDTMAGLPRQLANQLCDDMERYFSISLSPIERGAVGMLIRACRAKRLNVFDINDAAAYGHMQNLAYRMIDSFDSSLSPSLKVNEDLVHGLSLHLWSAIVRLKRGLELSAAIREDIQQNFPEVFDKSRQAAKVLEQELGVTVPDSEVAFIASHFGAALMHLGERSSRHVMLKAGIICVAGIGMSYMMASQVRQNYRGELEVEVSDWNSPEEWNKYDLLISSIPLEYTCCPVIMVNPILTSMDYVKISQAIKKHITKQAEEMPRLTGSLPKRLEKMSGRLMEMSVLLKGFSRLTIHADCSFDELAKLAGYRFGSQPESGNRIYEDLLKRESISTQVIEQLKVILLHTRTDGVPQPVLAMISPENGQFTNEYFTSTKGCLVMLVPKQSDKDILEIFGYISGALVEDSILLSAVQNGDEAVAYTRIEGALLQYLQNYWNDHLNK